jgi:hypothetical protein
MTGEKSSTYSSRPIKLAQGWIVTEAVTPAAMEGQGRYNRSSQVQGAGLSPALPMLKRAAREVPLPDGPRRVGTGRCEKIDPAEFSVDTKCMPMPPRTLQGHPRAIFYADEITPILKVDSFTSSRRNNPYCLGPPSDRQPGVAIAPSLHVLTI